MRQVNARATGTSLRSIVRILTPAVLDGYSRKKDKTVSVRFITQEMTSVEIQLIDSLLEEYGYLYFQPGQTINEQLVAEMEQLPEEQVVRKTPSQRLRNVLYVYHKEMGIKQPFDAFYAQEMENYIAQIKRRLP